MGEASEEIRCPQCKSDRICWAGVENDHPPESTGHFETHVPNPGAVILKWECFQCGTAFKQRVE